MLVFVSLGIRCCFEVDTKYNWKSSSLFLQNKTFLLQSFLLCFITKFLANVTMMLCYSIKKTQYWKVKTFTAISFHRDFKKASWKECQYRFLGFLCSFVFLIRLLYIEHLYVQKSVQFNMTLQDVFAILRSQNKSLAVYY